MEIGIKEKLERWKILAENYLKENQRVFIKDIEDNWYFADILLVGENTLEIQCYAPAERAGKKFVLYWALITFFNKDKNEVKNDMGFKK